jgi:hypothetical protein
VPRKARPSESGLKSLDMLKAYSLVVLPNNVCTLCAAVFVVSVQLALFALFVPFVQLNGCTLVTFVVTDDVVAETAVVPLLVVSFWVMLGGGGVWQEGSPQQKSCPQPV